jgi:hypothetical protein
VADQFRVVARAVGEMEAAVCPAEGRRRRGQGYVGVVYSTRKLCVVPCHRNIASCRPVHVSSLLSSLSPMSDTGDGAAGAPLPGLREGYPLTVPVHGWFTSPARSHPNAALAKELPLHLIHLILSYVRRLLSNQTSLH